jgi:hypothetical protein
VTFGLEHDRARGASGRPTSDVGSPGPDPCTHAERAGGTRKFDFGHFVIYSQNSHILQRLNGHQFVVRTGRRTARGARGHGGLRAPAGTELDSTARVAHGLRTPPARAHRVRRQRW